MHSNIILASGSPRRKQLLEMIGLPFNIITADIDETPPSGMPLKEVAVYLAIEKGKKVKQQQAASLVIAADTIVLLNDKLLGKPSSTEEAVEMLAALSGNMHEVLTGVAMLWQEEVISFTTTTEVYFRTLSPQQIQHYVSTYQPMDKAGAYAIQEYIGLIGITSIKGDYYNVMGLPVSAVAAHLEKLGVKI